MKPFADLQFNNSYARLPQQFYAHVKPSPLKNPVLASINAQACELLQINHKQLDREQFLKTFSGEQLLPGMEPLAMVYAGHQFGVYVPRLGDGRAILLGEVDTKSGPWELHLKGAGLTPYSRDGDGRAVLRSTIREYLCGEAMHGLGIASTRGLCIIHSNEPVYREQTETGALLVRMAPSHVRFGHFEYYYYNNDHDSLKLLADYIIQHHMPESKECDNPYLALLETTIQRTAKLMAQWQSVGFVHGVMNTDNMSILGLTLDYGPFGFMDTYQPSFGCNHSDYQGRYNYDQQPGIALYNLSCLAQALLPLLADDTNKAVELAKQALTLYKPALLQNYARLMRNKLGLKKTRENDDELSAQLHTLLTNNQVDYTRFFRGLSHFSTQSTVNNNTIRDMFIDRNAFEQWQQQYLQRLKQENSIDRERQASMLQTNPKYILRNYMADSAIQKATEDTDFSEVDTLLQLLHKPYDEQTDLEHYADMPPDWAQNIQLSCSS